MTRVGRNHTTVTDCLEYICVLCGQTEEKRFVEELIVRDSHKHIISQLLNSLIYICVRYG